MGVLPDTWLATNPDCIGVLVLSNVSISLGCETRVR
jgi:hypothetical protein